MKKLIIKSILIILPLFSIFAFVLLIPPSKSFKRNLLFSLIDKNELLKSTLSPRIIFIGGSNLSFGLDSKMIKDSLGLNPINTGIHAAIGLKYMLSNAEKHIRENDIIVVSPEYEQFYGDLANGKIELLSIIVDVAPKTIKYLDYEQYCSISHYLLKYFQSKVFSYFERRKEDSSIGIYDRKSFNSFGDAYIHWALNGTPVRTISVISDNLNDEAFHALNEFQRKVIEKKARLYITFPCYQAGFYEKAMLKIKVVEEILLQQRFKLLSSPERYIFPDSLIFNSEYHLTKRGVDLRTSLLINDLKKAI